MRVSFGCLCDVVDGTMDVSCCSTISLPAVPMFGVCSTSSRSTSTDGEETSTSFAIRRRLAGAELFLEEVVSCLVES